MKDHVVVMVGLMSRDPDITDLWSDLKVRSEEQSKSFSINTRVPTLPYSVCVASGHSEFNLRGIQDIGCHQELLHVVAVVIFWLLSCYYGFKAIHKELGYLPILFHKHPEFLVLT